MDAWFVFCCDTPCGGMAAPKKGVMGGEKGGRLPWKEEDGPPRGEVWALFEGGWKAGRACWAWEEGRWVAEALGSSEKPDMRRAAGELSWRGGNSGDGLPPPDNARGPPL
jgi:hypothetical protein